MADYGLKIAKPGKNAFSLNKLDILFNSNKAELKILLQGNYSISVPATGSRTYATIDHRLGFTPGFLVYVQMSGDTSVSYFMYSADLFSGAGEDCTVEANSQQLKIGVTPNGSTAFTALGKYYLLANRIDA